MPLQRPYRPHGSVSAPAEALYALAHVRTSSRNFAVLLFAEVELWDVASVMHVASSAGRHWNWRPFRLLPTAATTGPVETRSQLRVEAAFDLASCPAPEILFVPGGYGARLAARDERVVEWCAAAAKNAELTVAIGTGVTLLGAAGLLEGARVAVTVDALEMMRAQLPDTTLDASVPIVTSSLAGTPDKLITAASGAYGIDLGLMVVERVLGRKMAAQLEGALRPSPVTRLELDLPPKLPSRSG